MIFRISLALEDYQDHTNKNNDLINEAFELVNYFNTIKDDLSKEEKLKKSNELLLKLDYVFNIIGKEKFIFYNDGDVNYKWDDLELEDEKNE